MLNFLLWHLVDTSKPIWSILEFLIFCIYCNKKQHTRNMTAFLQKRHLFMLLGDKNAYLIRGTTIVLKPTETNMSTKQNKINIPDACKRRYNFPPKKRERIVVYLQSNRPASPTPKTSQPKGFASQFSSSLLRAGTRMCNILPICKAGIWNRNSITGARLPVHSVATIGNGHAIAKLLGVWIRAFSFLIKHNRVRVF